jgi:hypothetical protein
MLKSISFKKLAVLSAGIAIVLSSCGLQNSASESSGTETAAGKTKNFALSNGYCYDNINQWSEANNSLLAEWASKGLSYDSPEFFSFMSPTQPHLRPDGAYDASFDFTEFLAGLQDGVPCPVGTTFAEASDVPIVPLQSNGVPKDCYTQEFIDATIAGFEQQRDKADATDAYKAEMQKGIDTLKATCVKS